MINELGNSEIEVQLKNSLSYLIAPVDELKEVELLNQVTVLFKNEIWLKARFRANETSLAKITEVFNFFDKYRISILNWLVIEVELNFFQISKILLDESSYSDYPYTEEDKQLITTIVSSLKSNIFSVIAEDVLVELDFLSADLIKDSEQEGYDDAGVYIVELCSLVLIMAEINDIMIKFRISEQDLKKDRAEKFKNLNKESERDLNNDVIFMAEIRSCILSGRTLSPEQLNYLHELIDFMSDKLHNDEVESFPSLFKQLCQQFNALLKLDDIKKILLIRGEQVGKQELKRNSYEIFSEKNNDVTKDEGLIEEDDSSIKLCAML